MATIAEAQVFALRTLRDTRVLERPEGDSPDGESVALDPIRGMPSRGCREMSHG